MEGVFSHHFCTKSPAHLLKSIKLKSSINKRTMASRFEGDRNEPINEQAIANMYATMRRCYRMIGGVLVERTIKEVMPAVQRNKDGLEEVIARLNEALEKKKKEIAELESKYKIRIGKPDAVVKDHTAPKEASAQGVLVGSAGGSKS
ncbi:hypothetical protein L6164_017704 [Bauhinia variegata]|uniref:Uncharacterized protein n=1 Tax=Bauhinia variegata TaxID=167791 RepID=A0ACB9N8X9_BAUVA|nr:hypothetical protein L6164_017704 [Bauhinia variegata]